MFRHTQRLELISCDFTTEISFLDYIRNDTQIHFAVAIDFTSPNGEPTHPKSLDYYLNSNRSNNYGIALWSVGDIVQHYDTPQLFPAIDELQTLA